MSKITSQWGTLNLQDLLGEDLNDIIEDIRSIVTTLVDIIETISLLLEVIATVLGISVNLIYVAIQAVIAAIDAAIDFFVSTQLSVTYILPLSYRSGPTAAQNLQLIADSFYDITDPDRPSSLVGLTSATQVVGTGSNFFAMAIILASAPNIGQLIDKIASLLELFNIPVPIHPEISFLHTMGYPPTIPSGQGQAPDWISTRLSDIGIFGDIVQWLISLRNSIAVVANEAAFIRELIQVILNRIAEFNRRLAEIEELINQYLDLISISPGLHALGIYGEGTIPEQTAAIVDSINRNDFPLKESRQLELTASISLYTQSPNPENINTFTELLRLQRLSQDRIEESTQGLKRKLVDRTEPVGTSANQLKNPKDGFRE
jgi:hypothetical protein